MLLGLVLCGTLSACTETLIRRTPASGVLSNTTPTTSSSKSSGTSSSASDLSELQAELATLRSQYESDSKRGEILRHLSEIRIAHLEAVSDYQNIGLSILAKREDLSEAEERIMYSTLSTKAAVVQALAVRVVSAIDEALPLFDPDSEDHQDLEELKESLRVKLSKTAR